MYGKVLFVACLGILMVSCAQQPHNPNVGSHTTTINVSPGGSPGPIMVLQTFEVTAPNSNLSTKSDQATSQEGRTALSMPTGGSTASAVLDGLSTMEDIVSTLKAKAETTIPAKVDPVKVDPVKVDPVKVDPVVPAEEGTDTASMYNGLTNGNRPTWYFAKPLSAYPGKFALTVPGCVADKEVIISGDRWEVDGYLVKQSDVVGRGMAVLAPSTCTPSGLASIKW